MLQLVGIQWAPSRKQTRRRAATFAAHIAALVSFPSLVFTTLPANGQTPSQPPARWAANPFQGDQLPTADKLLSEETSGSVPLPSSSHELNELLARLEKVEQQLAAQAPSDPTRSDASETTSSATDASANKPDQGKSQANDQGSKDSANKSSTKQEGSSKNEAADKPKDGKEGSEAKKESDKKDGDKKDSAKKDSEKPADDEWVDLSSEKWTVKLGGHMQADMIHWVSADDPPIPARNYFEFRRLRLLADGTGYGVFDFRIQIDIEPEAEDTVTTPVTTIKDAYTTMHEVAFLQRIRVGNFFVPFSLEQVTNDTNNIFMERSIPTQGIFAADREVGFAFYGRNSAEDITWTGGVFLDSISEALKERLDDNQGHRLSWRTTWLPYYDEPSNGRYLFHTGVGILHTDDQDDVVRISARPQIHEGPRLIDSGNVAANAYTTGNLEFATVWGPISVQSELFLSHVNGLTTDSAKLYGAYTYFSYFLTGENRIYDRYGQHGAQFSRNVPRTNFFFVPGGIGSGGWEAKARMSYLDLNELNAGRYHDFTVGLNWYWTDRIRMMFDWIHPMTTADTTFGDRESDLLATRFDINF